MEADLGRLREYQWPRPDSTLTEGLRKEALRLAKDGKYGIGLYRVVEAGIFGIAHTYLCGMEAFLCHLLVEQEFAEELMRGILETQKAYYGAVLDEIGDLLDYVEIEDDLGMQDRPLVNPQIYRDMIKPLHKELGRIHKKQMHARDQGDDPQRRRNPRFPAGFHRGRDRYN